MLVNVPTDNVIVNEYHKLPASGVRPIPKELKKGLEEGKKIQMGWKEKTEGCSFKCAKTSEES